jgi:hypothetical protein
VGDLVYLLNTLVDKDGKILVTGLHDDVAELTPKDAALYDNIEFDVAEYKASVGTQQLLHKEDKVCHDDALSYILSWLVVSLFIIPYVSLQDGFLKSGA